MEQVSHSLQVESNPNGLTQIWSHWNETYRHISMLCDGLLHSFVNVNSVLNMIFTIGPWQAETYFDPEWTMGSHECTPVPRTWSHPSQIPAVSKNMKQQQQIIMEGAGSCRQQLLLNASLWREMWGGAVCLKDDRLQAWACLKRCRFGCGERETWGKSAGGAWKEERKWVQRGWEEPFIFFLLQYIH